MTCIERRFWPRFKSAKQSWQISQTGRWQPHTVGAVEVLDQWAQNGADDNRAQPRALGKGGAADESARPTPDPRAERLAALVTAFVQIADLIEP